MDPESVSITVTAGVDGHPVAFVAGRVMPVEPEGDVFYGLEPGTNGTATESRRALVERPGYAWRCHDLRPARGLNLRPSSGEDFWSNPWNLESVRS